MSWYAVRHFLKNGSAFEERITIRKASAVSEAIELAKAEARDYSRSLFSAEVLPTFQTFEMVEPPRAGSEVFSLIRDSKLTSTNYLKAFFATGAERQVTD